MRQKHPGLLQPDQRSGGAHAANRGLAEDHVGGKPAALGALSGQGFQTKTGNARGRVHGDPIAVTASTSAVVRGNIPLIR